MDIRMDTTPIKNPYTFTYTNISIKTMSIEERLTNIERELQEIKQLLERLK